MHAAMLKQRTLKTLIKASGVGLHTGQKVRMSLRPAPPDTGIVFRRIDLPSPVDIPARADLVGDARLASTLIKGGAKVVTGGERDGNFFTPTVLTEVTPSNDAYREELFGPVAVVYRVGSEEEAVKLANDTPFGLGSYLFTTDPEQAERVANQIEAGMVLSLIHI